MLNIGIVDDENSQAEGTVEGAAGGGQQPLQQPQPHPHYENIYAPISNNNINNNSSNNNNNAAVANLPAPHEEPQLQPNAQPQALQQQQQAPSADANAANANVNPQVQPHHQQRLIPPSSSGYRNDLYDRSGGFYDVPRSVRSGLGLRRNCILDGSQSNSRCNGNRYMTQFYGGSGGYSCSRQHSFDDTESVSAYMSCMPTTATMRYENIYEQIHDDPSNRSVTGACASAAPTTSTNGNTTRVYTRLNVLGHGIGRIERHLSSSCGNIDHYNVGGHYAVLGHSHFGAVGTVPENSSANAKDGPHVKTSTSSFFSCLHGENSQSMQNIYRTTPFVQHSACCREHERDPRDLRSASAGPANVEQPCSSSSGASSSSTSTTGTVTRNTGAIPKAKTLNKLRPEGGSLVEKSLSIKNAITKKTNTSQSRKPHTSGDNGNGTLNRISKSSLQCLLVNKWLPLWMGQGPDCKVIDFNFMFSGDCVDCEATNAAAQMSNPYCTPRLGGLPQDIMRFNRHADMPREHHERPLHNTLNRLRSRNERSTNTLGSRHQNNRYEDPSYENVHVQWQNGFEFGRSRDGDEYHSQLLQRPQLQRARSESPTYGTQQRRVMRGSSSKLADPFKNYELNADNNSFKPKLSKVDAVAELVEPLANVDVAVEPQPVAPVPALDAEGAVGGAERVESVPDAVEARPATDSSNLSANETETSKATTTEKNNDNSD